MAKIVIDARFYGSEHTGLGRYTTNILRFLPRHLANDQLFVVLQPTYYDSLKLPENCHKIRADVPHYSLKEQIVLPSLIDAVGADLTYILHFNVPVRLKTPYVVTIHDLIKSHFSGVETTTRSPWMFRIKRWGYDITMRHTITHAHAIITPTNTVKNNILALFNADPTYIRPIAEAPDGIFRSVKSVKPLSSIPSDYFLYVGNAYPHKNVKVLLNALEKLPHAELVMVAKSTPYLDTVMAGIKADVAARVTILESVSDTDLVSLYSHAKALIAPSLMEGYGLPGIEALMVGTPVIASNIPVYREVYGKNVTYFDPTNGNELAQAMSHIGSTHKPLQFRRTWDDVAGEVAEVLHESCARL